VQMAAGVIVKLPPELAAIAQQRQNLTQTIEHAPIDTDDEGEE